MRKKYFVILGHVTTALSTQQTGSLAISVSLIKQYGKLLHSTAEKAIYLLTILIQLFEMQPEFKVAMVFQPPVYMEACISHTQMHQLFQDKLNNALRQHEIYG